MEGNRKSRFRRGALVQACVILVQLLRDTYPWLTTSTPSSPPWHTQQPRRHTRCNVHHATGTCSSLILCFSAVASRPAPQPGCSCAALQCCMIVRVTSGPLRVPHSYWRTPPALPGPGGVRMLAHMLAPDLLRDSAHRPWPVTRWSCMARANVYPRVS